jgi:hypothetical protein
MGWSLSIDQIYETRQVQDDAHSKEQRQFTVIHLDEQAAKRFVLSSHTISLIEPLIK